MIKKTLALLGFFLLPFSNITAQETLKNIHQSLAELKVAKNDTSKVILLQKIAGHYMVTHLDSSKSFSLAGIKLAEQINFPKGKMLNLNTLGNYFERKTKYDSAMTHYNHALKIAKSLKSVRGDAIILNNIATVYIRKANYNKAIELLFEALKAEEKLNNKNGIAQAYNNIGICFYYQKNLDKTTYYLTKALSIQEELGNYDGLINGYNNVGAILDYQKKYDEAIVSYKKGLQISLKRKDKKMEASQLFNIGLAYLKKGELTVAENYLNNSINIRKSIKDFNGIASNYIGYGDLFFAKKEFKSSEKYYAKAMVISSANKLRLKLQESYMGVSKALARQNKHQKSNDYLQKYIALKDSILNEKNTKIIAEIETKYQTEKKEKEIAQQKETLLSQELKLKNRTLYIIILAAVLIIIAFVFYALYKKQQYKKEQLQKEVRLKDALAKIQTQNKLQEQRLRISRDLHDNIGSQLTFIISSIDNLKYVAKDINPTFKNKLSSISSFTSDTIFQLRDTIWAMNKSEISLEDLHTRMLSFIEKAKTISKKIEYRLEQGIESNIVFSAVNGIHIFRIVQEAINNAIKYANPTEIIVSLKEDNNSITIAISDDGIGFDKNEITLGNGLKNIQKRIDEIGGKVMITSTKDKGTTISFNINKQAYEH